MEKRKLVGDILVFLALTLGLSCIFYVPLVSLQPSPAFMPYVTGLMWSPAIAALLTVRLRRLDLASLGWGWGEHRWNLTAYLVPLGYAGLAYAAVWILGLGGFADAENIKQLRTFLGWTDAHPALVVIGYALLMASAGMAISLATALGEEIGWRGFLAPRVAKLAGFMPSVFIVAIIWGAWHMPLILLGGYNAKTEFWVAIPCFMVLVLGVSLIAAWLRLKSGSLWPAAILHASHNLFIQRVFTPLTGPRGDVTPYVIDEFGIAVPVAILIFAVWFWKRRAEVA